MAIKTFDEVMTVTRGISSPTAFDDAECQAMYEICAQISDGEAVVEIGCQYGRSSSIILQLAMAKDTTTGIGYLPIHVDNWGENDGIEIAMAWHKMAIGIGSPYIFLTMRSQDAANELINLAPFQLVFIDGDHTEAGVTADLAIAEMVATGGFLAVHDYGRDSLPDVYKVISEYTKSPKWDAIGVFGTLGVWKRTGVVGSL